MLQEKALFASDTFSLHFMMMSPSVFYNLFYQILRFCVFLTIFAKVGLRKKKRDIPMFGSCEIAYVNLKFAQINLCISYFTFLLLMRAFFEFILSPHPPLITSVNSRWMFKRIEHELTYLFFSACTYGTHIQSVKHVKSTSLCSMFTTWRCRTKMAESISSITRTTCLK